MFVDFFEVSRFASTKGDGCRETEATYRSFYMSIKLSTFPPPPHLPGEHEIPHRHVDVGIRRRMERIAGLGHLAKLEDLLHRLRRRTAEAAK